MHHHNPNESELLLRVRRDRRRERLAFLCLILLGGALVAGEEEDGGKVVTAERFVIQDADGKKRGELGLADGGFCRLVLRDRQGHDLVWLSANQEGTIAALILRDKAGTRRVELGGAVEGAALNLNNFRGQTRVQLYAPPDDGEDSRLVLFGPRQNPMAVVSVAADGSGRVNLRDKSGELVWKAP